MLLTAVGVKSFSPLLARRHFENITCLPLGPNTTIHVLTEVAFTASSMSLIASGTINITLGLTRLIKCIVSAMGKEGCRHAGIAPRKTVAINGTIVFKWS